MQPADLARLAAPPAGTPAGGSAQDTPDAVKRTNETKPGRRRRFDRFDLHDLRDVLADAHGVDTDDLAEERPPDGGRIVDLVAGMVRHGIHRGAPGVPTASTRRGALRPRLKTACDVGTTWRFAPASPDVR